MPQPSNPTFHSPSFATLARSDKLWFKNCPFDSPGTDKADLLEVGEEDEDVTKQLESEKKKKKGSSSPKGKR
jgi:hypothetical protein